MFHEWVTDANTTFRLMQREKLQAIMVNKNIKKKNS